MHFEGIVSLPLRIKGQALPRHVQIPQRAVSPLRTTSHLSAPETGATETRSPPLQARMTDTEG